MVIVPTYGVASDAETRVHGSWDLALEASSDPSSPPGVDWDCDCEISLRLQAVAAIITDATTRPLSGHERVPRIAHSPWHHSVGITCRRAAQRRARGRRAAP